MWAESRDALSRGLGESVVLRSTRTADDASHDDRRFLLTESDGILQDFVPPTKGILFSPICALSTQLSSTPPFSRRFWEKQGFPSNGGFRPAVS